ncbi:MAG: PilN domain-containing protein [Candidatus Zixiibacteriota bacterium]|nr:MAG: PilN domain-containing protein [candidate division Zixibacteria bacterium]
MIDINLLPKDYLKRSFDLSLGKTGMYALGGAAAVLVTLAIVTVSMKARLGSTDDKIAKARQRQAVLMEDIKVVDALTDVKQKITHRMRAVEKLDSRRSAWVRVLEDVARNVPEFVWLGRFQEKSPEADNLDKAKRGATAAKQQQEPKAEPQKAPPLPPFQKGEVEGYAFTLNALASFMIKMMRSDYFDEVELVTTNEVSIDEKKAYNFVLSFNIHYLSDEQLRSLIASEDEQSQPQDSKTTHKSLN